MNVYSIILEIAKQDRKALHNGMLMEKVHKFTETMRPLQEPRGSL